MSVAPPSEENKALELTNPGNAPVDLASSGYPVQMYFNGNTTVGTKDVTLTVDRATKDVVDTGVNLVDTVVRRLGASPPVDPQVEGRLTLG